MTEPRNPNPPTYRLLINGEWVEAATVERYERHDPFDGSVTARYANGGVEDCERAIASARHAFDNGPWPGMPAVERAAVLRRAAARLEEESGRFQAILTRELGQPRQANNVAHAVSSLNYFASVAETWREGAVTQQSPDALGIIAHEPVGVVGGLLAWNRPLSLCHKVGPALAAGCTVVLKPAHYTAGAVMEMARIFCDVGLPPGVFNVVTSDYDNGAVAGQAIALSPDVDMVTFTGSSATGRAVMGAASSTLKKVTLELGGKSPNVVFADAPFLEEAVEGACQAIASLSGQACIAGSRLLVENSIRARFVERLLARFSEIRLGDPLDPRTTMGPLVSAVQRERVKAYVEKGRGSGHLLVGGGPPDDAALAAGHFFLPTLFDDVDPDSTIAQEEIFGPVLCVMGFDTPSEAIEIANNTAYGLASGVWTRDLDKAMTFSKGVRAGTVWVNSFRDSGLRGMPAGGFGISGVGREHGIEGYSEFLETKSIHYRRRGLSG